VLAVGCAAAAARATPGTIDVARGFRPADVDPSSRDRRFLGCWIEIS